MKREKCPTVSQGIEALMAARKASVLSAREWISANFAPPEAAPCAASAAAAAEPEEKRTKHVVDNLSESQRRVVEAALAGQSFFFTGAAGTGKSYVIQQLEPLLREKHGNHVYFTASTGVAACNIGGVTLHSFAGIGLGEDSAVDMLIKFQQGRDPPTRAARERWMTAEVLVIEECSMISPDLFTKLDFIARNLRKDGRSKPFGGIQVILCGDFFQLPPVKKDPVKKLRSAMLKPGGEGLDLTAVESEATQFDFIFETRTWSELVGNRVFILREIYRQKDPALVALLNDVRTGNISDASRATFARRKAMTAALGSALPEDTVKLFSTRKDVEVVNTFSLFQLEGEITTFAAKDTGDAAVVKRLEDQWMAQKTLDLKIGASVMFIKNDRDAGVFNGTTGKVVGFYEWKKDERMPSVRVSGGGGGRIVHLTPQKWEVKFGKKVIATRTQVPLILSSAITIHKAQGLGIEHIEVNTNKIFEFGQLYVALSRATNLDGLYIRGPLPSLISPNPKVAAWWQSVDV